MTNSAIERWVDRYAARVRLGEFLRRAAETAAAFLFGFGSAVLIVKLLAPWAWPNVLWSALGVIPAGGLAWWLARRGERFRWESVARLDSALRSGGLLMMLSEVPDDDWSGALPQLEQAWRQAIPRVRPRRFAGMLALPLLFAAGACFVPLREGTSAIALRNTVGQQAAAELVELLDKIDEQKVLDEQEREQVREEIEKIAEETRDTPLTHEKWETVDALRERMKIRVESAAMIASQASEAAALLSESHLGDPARELSMERTDELENALGESLQKMTKSGACSRASQSLQSDLARLMKTGKLKLPREANERQKTLAELNEFLDEESKKLSELRKKCSSCKSGCKSGECESEGDCEGSCAGKKSGNPGRGGVDRGRGDAELTWGDEADQQGAKFKEIVLPKGLLDEPKDEVVAIQRTALDEEAAASAPRSAQRNDEAASGQSTWNRKLNPRHRQAVRKYFDGQRE
ncbi:MAG TPA: hypothetical protein VKU82_13270 [Planctomycetaceae bacterium]|nr:hypothetical protein [Planctomycetaceae bacterium]